MTTPPAAITSVANAKRLLSRLQGQTQASRYALLLRDGNRRVLERLSTSASSSGAGGSTGVR